MHRSLVAAAFVMTALVHVAFAQSLKLTELIERDRVKVAELAKETNEACGTQIGFQVDYPSFDRVLDDVNNQSPWAYLANATDALKRVCRNEAGKAAVKAKISSVTVSHGDVESETLGNGEFRYTVPYRGHSPSTVVQWLETNL